MINQLINHLQHPWYKGFRGELDKLDDLRYVCYGEIAVLDEQTVEITELPVKTWTTGYKESVLEPMLGDDGKGNKATVT